MSISRGDLESQRSRRARKQALALMYRCLASPTIRMLVPPINLLMLTSSIRPEAPPTQVVLEFPLGWGNGATHEWYMKQPTRSFVLLEYRKQKDGLRHEFVVITLNDRHGTLCRFDRVANDATRAYGSLDEGTPAKDTALILTTKAEIDEVAATEILLSLSFPRGEDLLLILATCYSLKTHPLSSLYQIFLYNCYFFSWTITCVAARRAVDWSKITQSDEAWGTPIKDSLKALAPVTPTDKNGPTNVKQSINAKISTRKKIARQLLRVGKLIGFKPKRPIICNTLETEPHEDKLKKLLYAPLVDLRQSIQIPFRNALFPSQLAPILETEIKSRMRDAATKAPRVSAALAAGTVAVKEVTNLFPARAEDLSYQGQSWSNCCDTAWAAAYEAAAAAEAAQPGQWGQEWDRAWKMHWGTGIQSAGVDTHAGVNLTICNNAKAAWRAERTGLDSVREGFISEVASTVTQSILKSIPDINDKQLRLGERAAAKAIERLYGDVKAGLKDEATQPPFQDYMRMRMQSHFQRLENFGVASQEEAMGRIEGVMCEIWVTTLGVLDGKGVSPDGSHLALVRMS